MGGPKLSDEEALHWLPPGWTEETYANATDEDWEGLSDELLELNMQRMATQARLNSAANIARIQAADAAIGRPPRTLLEIEHPLVKVVEDAGYEDFGFLLFRTDFTSESRWERFLAEWNALIDRRLDDALPETGLQRIKERVFVKIVDDECMSGMGAGEVALAFRMFKKDDDVEPGLDTKMCLMADAKCIASALEPDRTEANRIPPFVKAVDVSLPPGGYEDFTGTFKVAIESLVLEFWPALREAGSAAGLSAFEGSIWERPLG